MTIVLAIICLGLNAQDNELIRLDNPESRFKTDIQGSFPQHVVESNWWEGAWSPFGTMDIQYFPDNDIKVIESADGSGANTTKETFSYSDDGLIYQSVMQQWANNEWENMIRETENMGDDGNYIGYTIESWINEAWVLEEGMEYTYEMSGGRAVSIVIRSKYSGADWVNEQRNTFTYDGNSDQPGTIISELWEDGAWAKMMKTEITYVDSKTTEQIQSMWGEDAWSVINKMVLEERDNGSSTMTYYSFIGTDWMPSSRFRNENDNHGNEILVVSEMYAEGWMAFMGTQYLLTYDGNNLTQRITQGSVDNKPGMKTMSWMNTYKEEFSNFHSSSTGDILKDNIRVNVYPNPAVESIFVKINNPGQEDNLDVRIYSLSGQLVLEQSFNAKKGIQQFTLPVNDLKAGSYLFQVRSEKGSLFTNEIIQIQ